MVNKVIYNALNGHRMLNMYQMIINFGCMMKYYDADRFFAIQRKNYIIGWLPWFDILEIILYDLWLLTLWSAISVTKGCVKI